MVAVAQKGRALYYASDDLKNDKEIVMAAKVKLGHIEATDQFDTLKEVVIAAVAKEGHVLQYYASDELKNDKEVVMAAVAQYGDALYFASDAS